MKTHPIHMDINKISTTSTYKNTMDRFNEILQDKIAIQSNKVSKLNTSATNNKNIYLGNISKPYINLDAKEISKDVSNISHSPSKSIDDFYESTPMKGLGKSFEEAQNKYGINAYFLASLAGLESGMGRSKIAKDKNNLFGFTAYDNNPYGSARSFSSFEEGIDFVAKYLSENYINPEGKYFLGKSIKDINKHYATDKTWHDKIERILSEMVK